MLKNNTNKWLHLPITAGRGIAVKPGGVVPIDKLKELYGGEDFDVWLDKVKLLFASEKGR